VFRRRLLKANEYAGYKKTGFPIKILSNKKVCDLKASYGDIFYDYSKIYQSITGYEEILGERVVSNEYRERLKDIFYRYIINRYGEEYIEYIKVITASLYFSLLPLHKNDKCIKYYECISQFDIWR
jgi:hypothetical protein